MFKFIAGVFCVLALQLAGRGNVEKAVKGMADVAFVAADKVAEMAKEVAK